ncbi:DUF2510 domain-containing protein [Arthrobacter bambusae]|nr:DUF2510 domain-containing protein [Arthrobacter bambusae]
MNNATNTRRPGPGWYPDPARSGQIRWWSGTEWAMTAATPENPQAWPTMPEESAPTGQPWADSEPLQPDAAATVHAETAPTGAAMAVKPAPVPAGALARGIALSLIVIPAGAVTWVILWKMGFIASIVSFGIAAGAVALYRAGSRHRVNRPAFWALMAVIVAAVIVSFFSGLGADIAAFLHMDPGTAATSREFWDTYWLNITDNSRLWETHATDIAMTVLFTALGCFRIIRRLARESQAQTVNAAAR